MEPDQSESMLTQGEPLCWLKPDLGHCHILVCPSYLMSVFFVLKFCGAYSLEIENFRDKELSAGHI